jgi:hypothetical protein
VARSAPGRGGRWRAVTSRQARDAQRDTELEGKGYEILRIDEEELRFQPTAAAARVSRGLSDLIHLHATTPANSASAASLPSGRKPARS